MPLPALPFQALDEDAEAQERLDDAILLREGVSDFRPRLPRGVLRGWRTLR